MSPRSTGRPRRRSENPFATRSCRRQCSRAGCRRLACRRQTERPLGPAVSIATTVIATAAVGRSWRRVAWHRVQSVRFRRPLVWRPPSLHSAPWRRAWLGRRRLPGPGRRLPRPARWASAPGRIDLADGRVRARRQQVSCGDHLGRPGRAGQYLRIHRKRRVRGPADIPGEAGRKPQQCQHDGDSQYLLKCGYFLTGIAPTGDTDTSNAPNTGSSIADTAHAAAGSLPAAL